jgi:hypothetical protein
MLEDVQQRICGSQSSTVLIFCAKIKDKSFIHALTDDLVSSILHSYFEGG